MWVYQDSNPNGEEIAEIFYEKRVTKYRRNRSQGWKTNQKKKP